MAIGFGFSLRASGTKIIVRSTLIVTMFIAGSIGSGGNGYVSPTKYDVAKKSFLTFVDSSKDVRNNMVLEQIDTIKSAFSLGNEEISRILNVSTNTLYTWKTSGNIPKNEAQYKFFNLYVLAKEWLELGYPSDRENIFNNKINDETVFSSLSKFDNDTTLFMGRYLLRILDDNELI